MPTNPWNTDAPFSYAGMWIATKTCQAHINTKVSGDPKIAWLDYAIRQYFGKALAGSNGESGNFRCLVLGCNEGWVVERLCRAGFAGTIVASDVADKALARAEARISALGFSNVEYIVADLNTQHFSGPFDFIVAEGVLHHIEKIEHCLEGLSSALAKDGTIVMMEFEGPFRFQLPPEQVRWINAALGVLPKGLRPVFTTELTLPPTAADVAHVYYVTASAEAIEQFDPSEAICGHKLKKLIPRYFDVIERKPFGGTLLSYMTGHFPFERADTNPEVDAWLRVLIQIEDTVLRCGILNDEFVFYAAGRRSA